MSGAFNLAQSPNGPSNFTGVKSFDGISTNDNKSNKVALGYYNGTFPYSYIIPSAASNGFRIQNAAQNLTLIQIDNAGKVGINCSASDAFEVWDTTGTSQIGFGSSAGQGYLRGGSAAAQFAWGIKNVSGNWQPQQTSYAMAYLDPTNGLVIYAATGQTVGANVSLNEVARIDGTGKATLPGGAKIGASGTTLTQASIYAASLTPVAVAAQSIAEQTFTVTGLATNDKVTVNGPGAVGIVNARVSAANTLAITFSNPTAGSVTPPAGTYTVTATRS
jgi:hypothetical protein